MSHTKPRWCITPGCERFLPKYGAYCRVCQAERERVRKKAFIERRTYKQVLIRWEDRYLIRALEFGLNLPKPQVSKDSLIASILTSVRLESLELVAGSCPLTWSEPMVIEAARRKLNDWNADSLMAFYEKKRYK